MISPFRFPINTAYVEGWGLYSETLGFDINAYEDPLDRFGHLSEEIFRACRLGGLLGKAVIVMINNKMKMLQWWTLACTPCSGARRRPCSTCCSTQPAASRASGEL